MIKKSILFFLSFCLIISSLFAGELTDHPVGNRKTAIFPKIPLPLGKDTALLLPPNRVPAHNGLLFEEKQLGKIDTDITENFISSYQASPVMQREAESFCKNIEDQVQNARFTLQLEKLNALRKEINERIEILEKKRHEYESWLAKRNDFLEKTQTAFVSIVARMKPDAAAAQLALLDEISAASIILKLDTRTSSTILNNMPPDKSSRLMHILISTQKLPEK